jgi:3-methyladenine DNA glycosylase AlkD
VPVGQIKALGQRIVADRGRNHALAQALWDTGIYEARMLTSYIDDPVLITSAHMDRWARDFDNWAIVDTLCFHLFDRVDSALAFRKVEQWSRRREEFAKRAAFALLWSLALHDKRSDDAPFLRCLPLIERAASDERNFVKKGVGMALGAVGRRSPALRAAALALAARLVESSNPASRWVGKDGLRALKPR